MAAAHCLCLQTITVTVNYKHPPSKLLSGFFCLFCLFTLSCVLCRAHCAACIGAAQPTAYSSVQHAGNVNLISWLCIPAAGNVTLAAGLGPKVKDFVWRLTNGANPPVLPLKQLQ